ncbi:hypothetical protein THAOC_15659 [Thalassiosira oceanica]|uniref:Uncharacterized protein n=1 Tax=Thalassiosira oceanica TaxID=159749 RepID=K0SFB6_THAOC|nr:hypothetical protein THAOC_15659 [Thalassiosira oceanica]|eukprot:EJK63669.1 hypothetical protein THAOC_15659 [Thalassiosira oceanica]
MQTKLLLLSQTEKDRKLSDKINGESKDESTEKLSSKEDEASEKEAEKIGGEKITQDNQDNQDYQAVDEVELTRQQQFFWPVQQRAAARPRATDSTNHNH